MVCDGGAEQAASGGVVNAGGAEVVTKAAAAGHFRTRRVPDVVSQQAQATVDIPWVFHAPVGEKEEGGEEGMDRRKEGMGGGKMEISYVIDDVGVFTW